MVDMINHTNFHNSSFMSTWVRMWCDGILDYPYESFVYNNLPCTAVQAVISHYWGRQSSTSFHFWSHHDCPLLLSSLRSIEYQNFSLVESLYRNFSPPALIVLGHTHTPFQVKSTAKSSRARQRQTKAAVKVQAQNTSALGQGYGNEYLTTLTWPCMVTPIIRIFLPFHNCNSIAVTYNVVHLKHFILVANSHTQLRKNPWMNAKTGTAQDASGLQTVHTVSKVEVIFNSHMLDITSFPGPLATKIGCATF